MGWRCPAGRVGEFGGGRRLACRPSPGAGPCGYWRPPERGLDLQAGNVPQHRPRGVYELAHGEATLGLQHRRIESGDGLFDRRPGCPTRARRRGLDAEEHRRLAGPQGAVAKIEHHPRRRPDIGRHGGAEARGGRGGDGRDLAGAQPLEDVGQQLGAPPGDVPRQQNTPGVANVGGPLGRATVPSFFGAIAVDDAKALVREAGGRDATRRRYGAIATSGEWGLKNGCAVAYTDKGTGTGAHDLRDDTVSLIDGVRENADTAGRASNFTARISDPERAAFNEQTPNRFAFKHAHSQQNPEAEWGIDVLQSILFAFIQLNRHHSRAGILPANTIVIGSSVSNGGGASVRAAEIDHFDLIDGIAVSEPNVNPPPGEPLAIVQGNKPPYLGGGKPLYDYTTELNIFQGCANLAQPDAPLNTLPSFLNANRCASLRAKGLLTADSVAEQASEAQAIINGYGFLPEQNIVQPSHWTSFAPQAVSVTYANAYARVSVLDNLCGYSFGATDTAGAPIPLSQAAEVLLFGTANGIPPTGGVNVINNASPGGPKQNTLSLSPSTGTQDQNLDGALCLRSLWLGADPVTGAPLTGNLLQAHKRLRRSIDNVVASADLNGTPAIVVAGRSDAILPPNHTFRPYYARNRQIERRGRLRYVEVTNAQHLDAFNALAGFDTRFVPLHYYLNQALDLMYAHLKGGKPLPPSQVVHTTPRGGTAGSAPPISVAANLPPIKISPTAADRIRFSANTLGIPE